MKFWISVPTKTVCIDNEYINNADLSALPSNVLFVNWNGETESGELDFNNTARIRVPFTDPTPYFPMLLACLQNIANGTQTAPVGSGGAKPLNLSQAQAVMTDFVKTLFNVKRQAPIAFSGTSINATFDADDESVSAMTQVIAASGDETAIAAGVNNALTGLVSAINNALTAVVNSANSSDASIVSSTNSTFTNGVTVINTALARLITTAQTADTTIVNSANSSLASVVSSTNSSMGTIVADVNAINTTYDTDWANAMASLLAQITSDIVTPANTAINYIGNTSITAINLGLSNASVGTYVPASTFTLGTLSTPTLSAPTLAASVGDSPGASSGSGVGTSTIDDSPGVGAPSPGASGGSGVNSGAGASVNTITKATIDTAGPTIQWPPFGSTTTFPIGYADFTGIVLAINARRNTLRNTKQTKINAINALTRVNDVLAFSLTSGW